MKRIGLLSIAAAAVLLAALAGSSYAASSWPNIDSGVTDYGSGESIGTGSMDEPASSEPAVNEGDAATVAPDGAAPAPDNALGTGSMPSGSDESSDPGFHSQGGLTRPDIDLP